MRLCTQDNIQTIVVCTYATFKHFCHHFLYLNNLRISKFSILYLQGCMLVLSLTLVGSLTAFGAAVIRRGGYFYNGNGLMACEPFYQRPSLRILAACLFYFPTTMALMYFYGSALHVDRLRHRQQINICAVLVQPMLPNNVAKV